MKESGLLSLSGLVDAFLTSRLPPSGQSVGLPTQKGLGRDVFLKPGEAMSLFAKVETCFWNQKSFSFICCDFETLILRSGGKLLYRSFHH